MTIIPDSSASPGPGSFPSGVEITGSAIPGDETILTPQAMAFVAHLSRTLEPERQRLLQQRQQEQTEITAGRRPDFLPETAQIRAAEWVVNPPPPDLQDRRVEITGPVERKMMINALNSGANVFMADFEDANSPTWPNIVLGQINLRDAVNRTISFESAEGKRYALNPKPAVLMVRPRGWHLDEKHVLIDGQPVSAALFDFALFVFHNARRCLEFGSGPYFYLPKLEHYLEARLWNQVFDLSEQQLGLASGTIRATVLIETILAAFQMDEILWELREHSAGLNCGRWDYIFSIIKKFRDDPAFVLPDRSLVTMTAHMMRSYSLLCIRTCHRRETHAIGGMAAFIPVRDNPAANEEAIRQVMVDKRREASDGHDGTWVAHPGLVPVALDAFNQLMPQPNQIDRKRTDVLVSATDLLAVPDGSISERGVRQNINVGIRYLASWLTGQGAAAINHLMEDAATAEISRAQLWQWIHHAACLADGRRVTQSLIESLMDEEVESIRASLGEAQFERGRYELAARLMRQVSLGPGWVDFLTQAGYQFLP